MKLVKLTCPNCNAKLEVNSEMKQFTCNYCGTTTLLDDESVTVRNISSRLNNCLVDLKEYYDNGNYKKCLDMASDLLKDYPKNDEIRSYYNKCSDILEKKDKVLSKLEAIEFADNIKEKKYNVSNQNSNIELWRDNLKINEYKELYPDEKVFKEASEYLAPYIKQMNKRSKTIQQLITILAIVFGVLMMIYYLYIGK